MMNIIWTQELLTDQHFAIASCKDEDGCIRYGWTIVKECVKEQDFYWTGTMVIGKPFCVNLATKFGSLESCIRDIKDALSYDHGIRRTISSEFFQPLLESSQ